MPGLTNKVESAALLVGAPPKPLKTVQSAGGTTILLPEAAPDKISSTVLMTVQGALSVEK